MPIHSTYATGQHKTVEDLIKYAARVFEANRIQFRAAKMSKLIRSELRSGTEISAIQHMVDVFVSRELVYRDWRGFELFVASGYADPTGARAAHNVDRERAEKGRK